MNPSLAPEQPLTSSQAPGEDEKTLDRAPTTPLWSSPGRPVRQVLGAWVLVQGIWALHSLEVQPFQKSHCRVTPCPHLSSGLFQAQRHFCPFPQGLSTPLPLVFHNPRDGAGLCTQFLCGWVQLALKPSCWGLVQSLSCSLLGIAQLHSLCQSQKTVLFSPHQGLGPSVLHTSTHPHTRRWARPRPATSPPRPGLGPNKRL